MASYRIFVLSAFFLFAGVASASAQWTGVNGNLIRASSLDSAPPKTATTATPQSIPTKPKGSDWMLYEGTPIRMRLMRNLSSATAQEGESIDFETLDDISVNGVLVIPKNSTAMATVTLAQAKRHMGRAGQLAVTIDYVRLPNGEKLALRGVQNLKGDSHVGRMTGGIVTASLVFWPAAPFFLFMRGKDITIPQGQEVRVYTNSDYKVPRLQAQARN